MCMPIKRGTAARLGIQRPPEPPRPMAMPEFHAALGKLGQAIIDAFQRADPRRDYTKAG